MGKPELYPGILLGTASVSGYRVTARFYAVVARDTVDADFAAHRQRFLAEQGYGYRIMDATDALAAD